MGRGRGPSRGWGRLRRFGDKLKGLESADPAVSGGVMDAWSPLAFHGGA